MIRIAAAILAAGLAASPAAAGTYSASPATPLSERIITRNIVWHCSGASCRGENDASRPRVLCQSLAKRAGRLLRFTADGRDFTPEQLDRCNASAR